MIMAKHILCVIVLHDVPTKLALSLHGNLHLVHKSSPDDGLGSFFCFDVAFLCFGGPFLDAVLLSFCLLDAGFFFCLEVALFAGFLLRFFLSPPSPPDETFD
jgi:hypothetical protein